MSFDVCNASCQRMKQLSTFRTAMETAPTPEARQSARVQYYTLKEGQGWLHREKERIAREHILPVVQDLERRYVRLQSSLDTPAPTQTPPPSSTQAILDEARVYNRLSELQQPATTTPAWWSAQWIGYVLDGLIALLAIVCVYLTTQTSLFARFMGNEESGDDFVTG